MENKYREGDIDFIFPEDAKVIKFDDERYYRHYFNCLTGGKGLDFVVDTPDAILLVEIKDCLGHERESRHRTRTGSVSKSLDPAEAVVASGDRFSMEIPIKIAMSLACLIGAHTKHLDVQCAETLEPFLQSIISRGVCNHEKDIIVIVVLEGDFKSRTRSKKMIMDRIRQDIRSKLRWLSCKKVHVVDSTTYKERYFKMVRSAPNST